MTNKQNIYSSKNKMPPSLAMVYGKRQMLARLITHPAVTNKNPERDENCSLDDIPRTLYFKFREIINKNKDQRDLMTVRLQ